MLALLLIIVVEECANRHAQAAISKRSSEVRQRYQRHIVNRIDLLPT